MRILALDLGTRTGRARLSVLRSSKSIGFASVRVWRGGIADMETEELRAYGKR
jgi:hypothetical protein